jgi:hypothetical protein
VIRTKSTIVPQRCTHGLLSAFSQLAALRLAARFGLIETMVFTHIPANVFLVLAAFMRSEHRDAGRVGWERGI